ncbi:hypothetical protein BB559_000383 [Furculomyces boomerangus]|uniref:Uncharacterized protein n=2 Tax=Harpellales TaxID=61421 RepID=A0A2T9Z5G8_9FUNG|nr:hypothetical protein BB559_000383 [Furculomyces boomerangus]PVZ99218.1 hypothetical protein BB558_004758 [Smittium angustum]
MYRKKYVIESETSSDEDEFDPSNPVTVTPPKKKEGNIRNVFKDQLEDELYLAERELEKKLRTMSLLKNNTFGAKLENNQSLSQKAETIPENTFINTDIIISEKQLIENEKEEMKKQQLLLQQELDKLDNPSMIEPSASDQAELGDINSLTNTANNLKISVQMS